MGALSLGEPIAGDSVFGERGRPGVTGWGDLGSTKAYCTSSFSGGIGAGPSCALLFLRCPRTNVDPGECICGENCERSGEGEGDAVGWLN